MPVLFQCYINLRNTMQWVACSNQRTMELEPLPLLYRLAQSTTNAAVGMLPMKWVFMLELWF